MEKPKNEISVSHKEGKAEQVYTVKSTFTHNLDQVLFDIYQSDNFFGETVAIGFSLHIIRPEEYLLGSIVTKAAIKSDEDRLDVDLGKDIVLGRLIRGMKDEGSFGGSVQLKAPTAEMMSNLYLESMKNQCEMLKDYIIERSQKLAMLEMAETRIYSELRESFKKFK